MMRKVLLIVAICFMMLLASCQVITTGEGKSAYDIAVENGFVGTQKQWLESLKGEKGDSLNIRDIYEEYKKDNPDITFDDFLKTVFAKMEYLEGESAYDIAVSHGYVGTEEEWLASLKGERGVAGADGMPGDEINLYTVYEQLKDLDLYDGTYYDFAKEYMQNVKAENNEKISKALLSVVVVVATNTDLNKVDIDDEDYDASSIKGQTGAGVVFRINKEAGECFFVTNYHVIYDENNDEELAHTFVYFYGNEKYSKKVECEYIGGTAQYDLAVFRVKDCDIIKEQDIQAATFTDSDLVNVGTDCYAIGNPSGKGISVTKGIISVDSEEILLSQIKNGVTTYSAGMVQTRVIRFDAPVNHGNSGGGLFDENGKLVGIVNAKSTASDVDDMGYAIPSSVVNSIIVNILNNCLDKDNKQVLRCLVGMTITIDDSKAVYDNETGNVRIENVVIVKEVTKTGIASGFILENDIILEATLEITSTGERITKQIKRMFTLTDLCLMASVDDKISFKIKRGDEIKTFTFTFNSNVPQA